MTKKPTTIVPKLILGIFILGLFVIGYGAKTTEEITTIWTLAGIILLAISLVSLFFYEGMGTYYKTSYGIATVSSALSDVFKELDAHKELAQRQIRLSEAEAQPAQAEAPTSTYTPSWTAKSEGEGLPASSAEPAPGAPVSGEATPDIPETDLGATGPVKTGKPIVLEPPGDVKEKKKKESKEARKLRKYYKELRKEGAVTEEGVEAPPEAEAHPLSVPEEGKEPPGREPEGEKELPAAKPEKEKEEEGPREEEKEEAEEKEKKEAEEEKKGIQVLSEDELEDDASYQEIIERNF